MQCLSWRRPGWQHTGPCIPVTSQESVAAAASSALGFIMAKSCLPKAACLESCAGIQGTGFLTGEPGLLWSYGSPRSLSSLWPTFTLCSSWPWVKKRDGDPHPSSCPVQSNKGGEKRGFQTHGKNPSRMWREEPGGSH